MDQGNPQHTHTHTHMMYTDDILLFRPISQPNDYTLLQETFKLSNITNQCLLAFTKCKYLIASRMRQQLQILSPLTLADQPIGRVDQYCYLSIFFDYFQSILERDYQPDLC